jgi:hypothetical protein
MLRRVLARVGLFGLAWGLVPLLASTGSAKQGMVVTRDSPAHTFIGDIDETTEPGHIDINSPGGKISLDRRNVEKVLYFNTPAEEFTGRLSAMKRDDVAGRLDLANFAIANKMYPQARELLVSTLVIEPANPNAANLLRQVDEQIKASRPPETQQAVAPADPGNGPPAQPGLVRARRTLTPDEINFIRQSEWTENDQNIRVQVAPAARKGALDLGLIDPDAIGKMTPADIGWQIVKHGPPGLRKDVRIGNDPGSLARYRTLVHRFAIASCATGACHNTDKGKNFFLYTEPQQSDATVVTDYLIIQQFSTTIKGVEYQMLDRLHPENSLLVQFAVPPAMATVPHPKAAGYVPPAKTPFQLKEVQAWISSLPPVAPTYDIDLSRPAPKPTAGGSASRPPAG